MHSCLIFSYIPNHPKINSTLSANRFVKAFVFRFRYRFSQVIEMKNINLRVLLSTICVVSIMAAFSRVNAGPVRFDQVVQVLNSQPAKANTGSFTRLHIVGDYTFIVGDDDDDKKKAQ